MERLPLPLPLLLLLLLPLLTGFGFAGGEDVDAEEPHLLYLSDRNFEHDTQAATGQTTGSWLVLFTDSDCQGGQEAELALRKLLGETKDGHPLFAKVDVAKSPKTRKRFTLVNPPQLKLFRDRRMFHYPGGWSAASISDFVKEGWKETRGEEVPREAGLGDELWEGYSQLVQFLRSHPMALAVAGCVVAVATYSITSGILRPSTKPRRGKKSGRNIRKKS